MGQGRQQFEEQLYRAIRRVWAEHRRELLARLGFRPTFRRLNGAYWDRVASQFAERILPHLVRIYESAAHGLDQSLGRLLLERLVRRDAEIWARERARKLAAQVIETTQKLLMKEFSGWSRHLEEEDVEAALDRVLSPARAQTIATTETTQTITAGREYASKEVERKTGEPLSRVWQTSEDERTCYLCAPLHNTKEDNWGAEYPEGPPQPHPNCRCWLAYFPAGQEPAQDFIPLAEANLA